VEAIEWLKDRRREERQQPEQAVAPLLERRVANAAEPKK
jgi:hypothetical protein